MSGLPTRRQNAAVVYMLEHTPVQQEVQTFHFVYSDEPDRTYWAAAAQVVDEIYLVFTVASHTNLILFTYTDGDPQQVADILARAEAYHATEHPLDIGHTYRPEGHTYMEACGRAAFVVLVPKTMTLPGQAEALPSAVTLSDGSSCHLALATFLDEEEYALKIREGFDALLDRFIATDKDLYTFKCR